MRPICFYMLLLMVTPFAAVADQPVSLALRLVGWPEDSARAKGFGWSVFSMQYYSVSNWNAAGLAVHFSDGPGVTTALIYRDGIPGFAWYHLCLSQDRQLGPVTGLLQLRLSAIRVAEGRSAFRVGANLMGLYTIQSGTHIEISLFDLPGWWFPDSPVARGAPAMRLLVFHEPGRQIGLCGGGTIQRGHFGPIDTGVRVAVYDHLILQGWFHVLPWGVGVGAGWRALGMDFRFRLEYQGGVGATPFLEFGR